MDVGENQRPLYVPSVDLQIILGTQAEDDLDRIHYGVSIDLLGQDAVGIHVPPTQGLHNLFDGRPRGELVHRQDAIQLVIGIVFGNHG